MCVGAFQTAKITTITDANAGHEKPMGGGCCCAWLIGALSAKINPVIAAIQIDFIDSSLLHRTLSFDESVVSRTNHLPQLRFHQNRLPSRGASRVAEHPPQVDGKLERRRESAVRSAITQLTAHELRTRGQGLELAGGHMTRQRRHAAVGAGIHPLRFDVLHGVSYGRRHFFGALDLE